MCGIFAYVNYLQPKKREEIVQVLLQGLQRMEYRGYDSAGLSTGKGMRPNDCILQASPSTAAMT